MNRKSQRRFPRVQLRQLTQNIVFTTVHEQAYRHTSCRRAHKHCAMEPMKIVIAIPQQVARQMKGPTTEHKQVYIAMECLEIAVEIP